MFRCSYISFPDALLDLKKQRLLLSLQPLNRHTSSGETRSPLDDEEQDREEEGGMGGGKGERDGSGGEEDSDDLQGIKCRAPLEEVYVQWTQPLNQLLLCVSSLQAWGAVNYHNAVILCREEGSDSSMEGGGGDDVVKVKFHTYRDNGWICPAFLIKGYLVQVRVLFTHPTYKAMKPCPFFLDGKCKFDSSTCKFSHGHVVLFSELLTYQEPDYK